MIRSGVKGQWGLSAVSSIDEVDDGFWDGRIGILWVSLE